jgi:hypothetical protein
MLAVVLLSILLAWAVCASVLAGIGALLLRKFGDEWQLSDAFWAGLCVAVACLQIYQLFRPIDAPIAGLLCGVGLLGIILNRRLLVEALRRETKIGLWPALCAAAALLAVAARCAGPVVHYDTGLYGAMAVRWFVTYPLVPGLTNLLGQLGLNSSVFLCVAALDHGPWRSLAFHLFVGLLLGALVVAIVKSFFRIYFRQTKSALDDFILLLVIPGIVWTLNGEIVGTNTDLPTTIVSLAGAIALFHALQEKHKLDGSKKRIETSLLVAAMLFTLAVTFKISSVAFAGLGWGVVLFQLLSLERAPERKRKLIAASIGLSSVLMIPWLLRGVILSGYPFFPSSAFAVPLDWRVPRATADGLAQFDRSWARIPHASAEETSGIRWLKPWFGFAVKNRVDFLIPAFFALCGIIFSLRRKAFRDCFWFPLLIPSLGGLLFWFLLGPAFRFGEAAIWTTAACLGAAGLLQILPTMSEATRRVALVGVLALGGWCSYPRTIWVATVRPLLGVRGFSQMPEARTLPYRLASGLTVQVPIETNQCWNAPLPCSPDFDDSLRLRRDADLRWGFKIGGTGASSPSDKFTPLHLRYMKAKPTKTVCLNCHLAGK